MSSPLSVVGTFYAWVRIMPSTRWSSTRTLISAACLPSLTSSSSGYDSSDKVAQPTDPVIFTKRATSIIADGEAIFPHTNFTESLDYEGEIGVIIGKAGFRISENDAMNHVWGYTIVNDVSGLDMPSPMRRLDIGTFTKLCQDGPRNNQL